VHPHLARHHVGLEVEDAISNQNQAWIIKLASPDEL